MSPRRLLSSLAVVGGKREYRAFLLIMVLTSLGTSSSAPLISLYLVTHLHVALSVVGLFFASQALPGFVLGLLLGRRSDRWRSRLPAIRLAAVWIGLGWLVFAFSPYVWLTFAVGPVFLSAGGAIMGQVFAALHDVMTRDRETQPSLINTTIRTGWSLGFVFGPLLGSGLAAQVGFRAAFVATAGLYLLCLAPLRGLDVAVLSAVRQGDAGDEGLRRHLRLYLFAGLCALVLCGTAITNSYLPIDVTTHLGVSVGLYGTIVAISPVVELVAMPLSGVLSLRFPIGRLILGGLVVACVEYLLLASSTALWQLYLTQALDAWVVAVVMGLGLTYAQQLSPDRAGLASGTFGSSYGVAMVVGNLIGSASVPLLGVPHVFFIPTALCAVSLLTFLGIERASAALGAGPCTQPEKRSRVESEQNHLVTEVRGADLLQPRSEISSAIVDGQGNVYIAHCYNGLVRKVDTCGTISTFASGGSGCIALWRRHRANRANRTNPCPLVRAASVRTPVPAPTVARICGPILRRGRDDRAKNRPGDAPGRDGADPAGGGRRRAPRAWLLLAALFAAAFGFWVGVAFFAIEWVLILALAILAGRGG